MNEAPQHDQNPLAEDESTGEESDDSKFAAELNFVDWWDAVLRGDPQAQDEAMRRLNEAIEPMLKRCYPKVDANDITASIQRTIFRRIQEDPDSLRVTSFAHFLNQAKVRARNKARNAVRKRRPNELPQFVNEAGELRTLDPVDHREDDPAQQAVDHVFIDGLIQWAEREGEPTLTILLNYLQDIGDNETANQLYEKGIERTADAVRSHRGRIERKIKKLFGDDTA